MQLHTRLHSENIVFVWTLGVPVHIYALIKFTGHNYPSHLRPDTNMPKLSKSSKSDFSWLRFSHELKCRVTMQYISGWAPPVEAPPLPLPTISAYRPPCQNTSHNLQPRLHPLQSSLNHATSQEFHKESTPYDDTSVNKGLEWKINHTIMNLMLIC